MSDGTPAWLQDQIRAYYTATNERSYLANWSQAALSFHHGMADETTASLDEAHTNTNRFLAERLGITAGTRVLDAGCGVGGTSLWLAAERGARPVGVTLDPAQVAYAERFARERGVEDRVEFRVADYAHTDLAPASFDVVFHLESLCHTLDVRAPVRHAFELLAPGGRYADLDCFPVDRDSAQARAIAAGWVLPNWPTLDETVAALHDAGFTDVTAEDHSARLKRPAEQLRAMAHNSLLFERLARAPGAPDDGVFHGHLSAAVAMADALLSGTCKYYFVHGRKPASP